MVPGGSSYKCNWETLYLLKQCRPSRGHGWFLSEKEALGQIKLGTSTEPEESNQTEVAVLAVGLLGSEIQKGVWCLFDGCFVLFCFWCGGAGDSWGAPNLPMVHGGTRNKTDQLFAARHVP